MAAHRQVAVCTNMAFGGVNAPETSAPTPRGPARSMLKAEPTEQLPGWHRRICHNDCLGLIFLEDGFPPRLNVRVDIRLSSFCH